MPPPCLLLLRHGLRRGVRPLHHAVNLCPKVPRPQFVHLAAEFSERSPAVTVAAGIRQPRNRCSAPVPLRTQGCCDPCHKGHEPSPDTYITPPAKHLLAA